MKIKHIFCKKQSTTTTTTTTTNETTDTTNKLDSNTREIYANGYINLNGEKFHHTYCNNTICSARYTWYNFILKNLYEQFHNIANVYFLLIIITYFFVDHVGDVTVTIMPLFIILLITMIKDGIEDILRHNADKQLNSIEYLVLNIDFHYKHINWILKKASMLSVGDVIRCNVNQSFPCDLLLLSSSNSYGQVCITTANLDGECNIKKYSTLIKYQSIYQYLINNQYHNENININLNFEQIIKQLYLYVNCQQPTNDLTLFQGHYSNNSTYNNNKLYPLTIKNLALRGTKLISTDYIIGLVIYTGKDTKLSLNSQTIQRKYSTRENLSNIILLIFILNMIIITLLLTILSIIWINNNSMNIWYITFEKLTKWQFISSIIRFLFIMNYLIPIAIIITIEFQQLLLVYLIKNDRKMYSIVKNNNINNKNYAINNNSQLIDELGQIEFLFSDKTGTLTQNHMILRLCCLLNDGDNNNNNNNNEQVYKCDIEYQHNHRHQQQQQHRHDDVDINNVKTNKTVIDVSSSSSSSDDDDDDDDGDESIDINENYTTLHNHQSLLLLSKINYNIKNPKQPDMNENLRDFLTIAALCHTVDLKDNIHSIENDHLDNNNMNKHDTVFTSNEPPRYYEYEATSSDEKALVEGASLLGVVYSGKQLDVNQIGTNSLYIDYWSNIKNDKDKQITSIFTQRQCYHVDAILEFDSLRKCMSVMVRYPDETCYVLSKGAEISILDPKRCSLTSNHRRTQAIHYVNEFAINGLRTLVFAKRQLHKNDYMKLLNNLKLASNLIGKARNNALKKCYEQIECDMVPICVTGIEDKLQPGVKKCIQDLKEAGIQIWILTGDKAETAIRVSQSIGHLTPNMSLIRIMNCQTLELTAYKIYEQLTGLRVCQEQQQQQQQRQQEKTKMKSMMNNDIQNSSTILHNQFTVPRIKTINYNQNGSMNIASSSSSFASSSSLLSCFNRIETTKHSIDRNDEVYYYDRNKFLWNYRNCLLIGNCKQYIRRKHKKYPGMANESIGLIIDGQSLQYALHTSLRHAFLELCMNVTTVLCCRMTPLQKASIVKLVQIGLAKYTRQGTKPVIAAIGDGGNDVAMILQANIGVGVLGKEGREAACASDYAVTQFKHIKRLFLLHGHWAYYRITMTMLFFYHKAVAFVFNQICLTWFTGFSEIPLFGTILFICYNLTMTFLVSLGFGMFERHIQEKILLNKPHLYKAVSHQANLRAWYILLWILDGIWHGIVTFFMPYFCLAGGNLFAEAIFYESNKISGGIYDFTMIGNASFVYLWIAITLRSTIWTRDFNIMLILCHICTSLNVVILFVFQTFITSTSNEYQRYAQLCRSPAFWFTFPLTVFIANMPALLWRFASDTWWTMYIKLKNLSKYDKRELYSINPLIWLKVLINSQTEKNETYKQNKKSNVNNINEYVNNEF
ncbi:hypothetical protein MN116_008747 [Schistosoma mekongi]|uniref:Phospholipid-transporting ATPase n=1 Tax=Schistosoma mekongi TaxID=38744 RepID=A0AAE1Z6N9_SCHME|nr:hypothetical protein MN116_008747 [Schistosoma mekongi]